MKYHPILSLLLLFFLTLSCSSKTAQDTKTDNVTTENIGTISSEEATTSDESEATTVAVSTKENEINKATHDKEIELINTEISKINQNLASYTKEEEVADWETIPCQLKKYKNEHGLPLKIEAVCGDHSWEIYAIALSETSSKLLYGKYLEKIPDAPRPSVREFYSIGSMIASENAYTLILDESGNEVDRAGYRKYSVLYEAAFDAFYND